MFRIFILIIILYSTHVFGKHEDYKDYKVFNIKVNSEDQEEKAQLLKSDYIDFLKWPNLKYDVIGKAVVPPSQLEWFEEQLEKYGFESDVYIEDLYQYLNENDVPDQSGTETTVFDYENYYRYEVILNHIYNLRDAYQNSPINFEVIEYGSTTENRPLVYIKISSGNEGPKPTAIVEAAISPRDWVTVPIALNIVEKLMEETNRELIVNTDWIVIPILNPDGYEYTHTNLRLWTKNRSTNSHMGAICPGVHLDRNFNIDWMVSDSSSTACSHLYAGPEPFSEIESRLIRDLVRQYIPELYLSLHTGGNFLTFPWRFEKAASGLFRRHYLLGLEMLEYLPGYILDSGAKALGDRVSGTSTDYARNNRAFYTFNLGIEGEGEDGVLVPAENIKNVVDNVWGVFHSAARHLASLTNPPTNTDAPTVTNPPTNTDAPTVTSPPTNTDSPAVTNPPTNTDAPTVTNPPTNTDAPTVTNPPTNTDAPTVTNPPTNTDAPTVTNPPTNTDAPTVTSPPTNTDAPTVTNPPTNTDAPTVTNPPTNTDAPTVTSPPTNTDSPAVTNPPTNTDAPTVTNPPTNTDSPTVTNPPTNTDAPTVTNPPTNTDAPTVTNPPTNTDAPTVTNPPTNTDAPTVTSPPTNTDSPAVTNPPTNTDAPTVTNPPTNTDSPTVTNPPTNTDAPTVTNPPTNTDAPTVTNPPTNTDAPTVTSPPTNTDAPTVTNPPTNTDSPTVTNAPPVDLNTDFPEIEPGTPADYYLW